VVERDLDALSGTTELEVARALTYLWDADTATLNSENPQNSGTEETPAP
jgi:hypothetical protein